MQIDGETKVCGLIGAPVAHSLSPQLHNGAYRALGLNYRYLPFYVPVGGLENALRGIAALGIKGVNITSPHKEAALPFLDTVHPTAAAIGAVNTVCNRAGKLCGFNTDGDGLLWALREELQWTHVAGSSAVILGAGGAARAAAYALARAGVAEIVLLNRTARRAEAIALMVGELFPPVHTLVEPLTREALCRRAARAALLINTLPAEPWEWDEPVDLDPAVLAFDLRYSPPHTAFLEWAANCGARCANGLHMLVGQAALSFNLFTGAEPPFALMRGLLPSEDR